MTDTISLFIPKPDEWINANQKLHWAVKNSRVQTWRDTACYLARQAKLPQLALPASVNAYIIKDRGSRYDPNNLADTTKACIDGLVDAGVLPDDSWQELIGPDHRHGGKGRPGIIFEFRHLNGSVLT